MWVNLTVREADVVVAALANSTDVDDAETALAVIGKIEGILAIKHARSDR